MKAKTISVVASVAVAGTLGLAPAAYALDGDESMDGSQGEAFCQGGADTSNANALETTQIPVAENTTPEADAVLTDLAQEPTEEVTLPAAEEGFSAQSLDNSADGAVNSQNCDVLLDYETWKNTPPAGWTSEDWAVYVEFITGKDAVAFPAKSGDADANGAVSSQVPMVKVTYLDGSVNMVPLPEGSSICDEISAWMLMEGVRSAEPAVAGTPSVSDTDPRYRYQWADVEQAGLDGGTSPSGKPSAKPAYDQVLAAFSNSTEGVDYAAHQVIVVFTDGYSGGFDAAVAAALGVDPSHVKILEEGYFIKKESPMALIQIPEGVSVAEAIASLLQSSDVFAAEPNWYYQLDEGNEGEGDSSGNASTEDAEYAESQTDGAAVVVASQPQTDTAAEAAVVSSKVASEASYFAMNVINGNLGTLDVGVVGQSGEVSWGAEPREGDTVRVRASRAGEGAELVRMSCTAADPATGEMVTRALERVGAWDPESNDYEFTMPSSQVTLNVEWAERR